MNKISDKEKALVPSSRPLSIFDVWETLSREMEDSWMPFTFDGGLVPHTDIREEKGQLVMKTELPGIEKKDLDISLEGNRLTIKAEKKEETKKGASRRAGKSYYEQYFHSLTLPYPVKEDKVTARFDKGVLELRLPRGEEVKPRKIEIKAQLPKGEPKKLERKPEKKES